MEKYTFIKFYKFHLITKINMFIQIMNDIVK